MHTLLIVDDEPHSRDGLARLVRQSDLAIDQVQTASNGLDALALARQQAPDILLCDVRMPRMDGLTLATEVRRLFPGCQILFISGYSDREYLKTAFSLRAVDFIDKPINTVQLLDALRSALSNLEARRQQHDLLRERAAVELTVPGTHPCLARLRAQNTDFFAEPACFCALLLLRAATDEDLRRTAECLLTLFPKALVAPLADSIVLHMPLYTPALLRETADGLFRALPGSENAFLAVGTPVKNADDLPSSFRAASALRERVFFAGYGHLLYTPVSPVCPYDEGDRVVSAFSEALRGEENEARRVVERLLLSLRTPSCAYRVDSVRALYYRLLETLHTFPSKEKPDSPEHASALLWQRVNGMDTLCELNDYLMECLSLYVASQRGRTGASQLVFRIRQYIASHFQEGDLTIRSISVALHFTPAYLCQVFKAETGRTINNYINDFRLERAKELLRQRDSKLYEVSQDVGFGDANYFTRQFKKYTGMTPSDYRRKYQS